MVFENIFFLICPFFIKWKKQKLPLTASDNICQYPQAYTLAVYKQRQQWNGLQSKGFSLNGIVH